MSRVFRCDIEGWPRRREENVYGRAGDRCTPSRNLERFDEAQKVNSQSLKGHDFP